MTISKALTTENIVPILKRAGFVTKDDLTNFAKKSDLKNLATKDDILASERRMKFRMGKIRNDLALRIAKLATETPTYKEFETFKRASKSYL